MLERMIVFLATAVAAGWVLYLFSWQYLGHLAVQREARLYPIRRRRAREERRRRLEEAHQRARAALQR